MKFCLIHKKWQMKDRELCVTREVKIIEIPNEILDEAFENFKKLMNEKTKGVVRE